MVCVYVHTSTIRNSGEKCHKAAKPAEPHISISIQLGLILHSSTSKCFVFERVENYLFSVVAQQWLQQCLLGYCSILELYELTLLRTQSILSGSSSKQFKGSLPDPAYRRPAPSRKS
jgi:hypothetical protein